MTRITVGALILLSTVPVRGRDSSAVTNWQKVQALPGGDDVRVDPYSKFRWLFGKRPSVSGQIQSVTDDSLVVTLKRGPHTFMKSDIARVSVKEKAHRWRSAGSESAHWASVTASGGFPAILIVPGAAVAGAVAGAWRSHSWRVVYRR
ncbi:MAG: hypothetical protein ACRD5L_15920 [Bryobacteraceae bacterium]